MIVLVIPYRLQPLMIEPPLRTYDDNLTYADKSISCNMSVVKVARAKVAAQQGIQRDRVHDRLTLTGTYTEHIVVPSWQT